MFVILVMLGGVGALVAGEMTVPEYEQVKAQAENYMGPYAEQVAAGEAPPIKCAVPLVYNLTLNRPKSLAEIAGPFDRRDTLSFRHGTTHFLLHYTNQGLDSIYQYSRQDSLVGVPNYIFEAGKACERAWAKIIDTLGFRTPKSDGYYSGGGDGRIDVYFVNQGYYGATIPESIQTTLPLTSTAYMLLENDYAGFPGYGSNRLAALRVSAAHEFFHCVQFNIDLTETEGTGNSQSTAWVEMSATFMEEDNYPDVNDYFGYLRFFYYFPQWSLRAGYYNPSTQMQNWMSLHQYGAVVFPIFLSLQFGDAIIKTIWDGCGAVPGGNWWLATNDAIKAASSNARDMRSIFREFTLWNLFTGNWRRPGQYFPDDSAYPSPISNFPNYTSIKRMTYEVSEYPAIVTIADSLKPDNLGCNYILLNNLAAYTTGLAVSFQPDIARPWTVMVVGLPLLVYDTTQPIFIDTTVYDSSTTQILIPNAASFHRIVLIPSVLGGNGLRSNYSLNITPLREGVSRPNGGEKLYAGIVYTITWFFDPAITSVKIEFSSNNGATWSEIATTPNVLAYSWMVPNIVSDSCLIKVSNAANGSPFDVSDGVFSIGAAGENRILDPYPNPVWVQKDGQMTFTGELQIGQGSSPAEMTVTIMTIAGEKVATLRQNASAGAVTIAWNLTNDNGETVAAGPYLAVIEFAGQTKVKKFVVLR